MPVKTTRLRNGKTRVSTPNGVRSKGTTKAKAEAQARLLRGIEHGWKPSLLDRAVAAGKKGKKS